MTKKKKAPTKLKLMTAAKELSKHLETSKSHGVCFQEAGVSVIAIGHILTEGQKAALVETLLTTIEEFYHYAHPTLNEHAVNRWFRDEIDPRLPLLREFVRGLKI